MPVGHVALDLRPAEDTRLGLRKAAHTDPAADLVDDTVVWVANLYVSHALQDCGFGRDTMRCAEEIASLEPLRATCVVLDTSSFGCVSSVFFPFPSRGWPLLSSLALFPSSRPSLTSVTDLEVLPLR